MTGILNISKERFFPFLTHNQVKDMDNKEEVVLVLPFGTVEQHGAHLPLFTDSLISSNIVFKSLDKLPADVRALALAPLFYGKSNEHQGFSGTMYISASTLLATILEIITGVYEAGFRKLILANGHGGQPQVLEIAARDCLSGREDLIVIPCSIGAPWIPPPNTFPNLQEKEMGIHGGFIETSIIMSLYPGLVDIRKAKKEYPKSYESAFLTLEGGISPSWITSHLSLSGIIGDPTAATNESGDIIVQGLVAAWCALISDVYHFKRPKLDGKV